MQGDKKKGRFPKTTTTKIGRELNHEKNGEEQLK